MKIRETFENRKKNGQKALVTYIVSGDYGYETTKENIRAMVKAGADVIEIGIPFSDPIAEGVVIQEASQHSLAGGTTLKGIFQMVKELREMTGAGMMDCKKALTATEGDMDKAVEFLREKGLATAQKKASRVAAEGLCKTLVSEDGKKAVVVEVNAETDFVAKNEKFQNYVADVAAQAMNTTAADIDAFLAEAWALDTTKTVKEALAAQIAVIGENMNIRRFAQVTEENGFVASYTHMGGKIGVLVDVETDVVNDAVKEMAKNVAMQIAALKPQYTSDSEVSAEYIEHEKEILMAQIQNDPKESQKPAKVIEGMITGRIKKELKEICLLDQTYVKAEDGKQSVAKYVEQVAKENGAKITVKGFVRYETGDGIEKKEENFAEEVAKQMGK